MFHSRLLSNSLKQEAIGPDLYIENLLWLLNEDWIIQGRKKNQGPKGEYSHIPAVCLGSLAKAPVNLGECLLFAEQLMLD